MGKPQPLTAAPAEDLGVLALGRWFDELADRGILVTDEHLVIRAWNPWLVQHTGIAAAEAIGRPLLDVCPSIAARGLDEFFHDALTGEVRVLSQRLHKYLIPVVRSTIDIGPGEAAQSVRIAPLVAPGGIVGTVTLIEDVSERVATERELRAQIIVSERARNIAEEASKLKDEFLATLSHEIRTPLNAVLGWARILRTQSTKSPARGLEVIERNAIAQLRLVEDLLDMARVMSGKLRLEIAPVSVEDIMRAAIDVIEPAAAARHISIHPSFDEARPSVSADTDRLQQVFWNVLSNAVKFTPDGGRIDVSIRKNAAVVEITVADNGQGIGPDFLPYVFDRFRQADASPARRQGGLGLGLALVRHIVELHGGRVVARSPGVDKGTTFSIQLPVADVRTPPPSRETAASFSGGQIALAGVRILLVDDSADGREMLEVALRAYGAEVVALDSPETALTLLAEGQVTPDVIISDIGMPGVDGYEFIRRVRTLPALVRQVPAIAVSAYANPEERIQALVAGYQHHLAKPVDPALVGDSVRRLVAAS